MMKHTRYNQIEQGADTLIALFGENAILEARREQRMAEMDGRKNECLYWQAVENETRWILTVGSLTHHQAGHA